jgi:hypothetical protein
MQEVDLVCGEAYVLVAMDAVLRKHNLSIV